MHVNINIHHKNEKSAEIFRAFDETQAKFTALRRVC